MELLTLIACRKNSKRVKNKNLQKLGGIPLVQWTFDLIKKNKKFFRNVIVSTDDQKIINLAKRNSINAPFLRPKNLSSDHSKAIDVAIHAIKFFEKNYKKIDALLYLQPTSPFRNIQTIRKAINIFIKKKMSIPVVSLSRINFPINWIFYKKNNFYYSRSNMNAIIKNSQDQDSLLILNGYLRVCSKNQILKKKRFILEKNLSIICNDPKSQIDIDSLEDLKNAQNLI